LRLHRSSHLPPFPYTTLFRSARHHAREPGVEREPQSRPERHDQIEEHRHPGRRNVNEDDAIGLALLSVGGSDEESEVQQGEAYRDRKSTRLNSSHVAISYAVF